MTEVRAAVCRSFRQPLTVETLELREPGEGEVLVRVGACGICQSDLAYIDGVWGGELPAVFGHEAAGRVELVGSNVSSVRPGDTVVVTLIRSCGRCSLCVRGEPALCLRRGEFAISASTPLSTPDGEEIAQGLRTAAFAEAVLVHESQVVAVPSDLPVVSAALIGCAVVTGVGAVFNTAQVDAGESLCVIGAGGVGLNAVQAGVLANAAPILAVDPIGAKRHAALQFGATETASPDADLTGRSFDHVIVTAGSVEAVELGLKLVADAGTAVLVGLPGGRTVPVDPEAVADRSLRILGSKLGATRPRLDIPAIVSHHVAGRLKLAELVTRTFELDEINDALTFARTRASLRTVLVI
jgi:Zn-dependent alcohol dehydrogenase